RGWDKYFKSYRNSELILRRDELRMLWAKRSSYLKGSSTNTDWENVIGVPITKFTEQLYEECEARYPEPLEKVVCEHWLSQKDQHWNVVWTAREKRLAADPKFLPSVLALGC